MDARYDAWLGAILGGAAPVERKATCDACAMVAGPDVPPIVPRFDARSKCCTYQPELPNFSVGMILADRASPGRAVLKQRFAAGTGVTPLGLVEPIERPGAQRFGRDAALNCTFLDEDQRCGIWAYRDSTCRTYFCKLERGAVGMRFWKALQQLLYLVERQLAAWCVVELDLGPEASEHLFAGHRVDLRALWGRWSGREVDFFVACAEKVAALDWADVLRIGGPDVAAWTEIVRHHHAALAVRVVPEAVKAGRFRVVGELPGGDVLLSTYSTSDLPRVPAAAVPGGGVTTTRALPLAEETLFTLLDHEVLVPASALLRRPVG